MRYAHIMLQEEKIKKKYILGTYYVTESEIKYFYAHVM
jgi:hypothetical protein